MTTSNINNSTAVSKLTGEPLKKRGRKSKKELLEQQTKNIINNTNDNVNNFLNEESENNEQPNINILIEDTNNQLNIIQNDEDNEDDKQDNENIFLNNTSSNIEEQKPIIKKRGRKPKGGKIIQQIVALNNNKDIKPNIILHLKCSLKDLYKNVTALGQATETSDFMSYNEYSYDAICQLNNNQNETSQPKDSYEEDATETSMTVYDNTNDDNYKSNMMDSKHIFKKLKSLQHNLHINNVNDKKSACFWCTCDFDNPPIYIPKHFIKETYEVYGCFCSPECGTAYLMKENIDISEKFERYHLINNIYTKIYDYKKSIKPAPDPYYILDKYYGNLSIQEYRTLLRGERLFLVVDKPLTRILPELHEDNDDFIINNKIIPSNTYQIKKKLQKKQTKNNILNEKFGLASQ